MNTHKIIHTCLYDMQQIQKEEYVNVNVVWVPLCTDVQRQILYIDTFTDNSFFAVKVLILLRWKKYMKHYSIILWYYLMTDAILASKNINHLDTTWWKMIGLLKMIRLYRDLKPL